MKKILATLICSVLVVACGDKTAVSNIPSVPSAPTAIEGTYIIDNQKGSFTFTKDGEVTYKHPQYSTKVTDYKMKDSEISFQFKEGYLMKMSIIDDRHLKSMVGDTYVKQ